MDTGRGVGRRARVRIVPLFVVALVVVAASTSMPALAADDAAQRDVARARADKLRNAAVEPVADLHFGAEPLAAITETAARVVETAGCAITAEQATALALAPTWPETSGDGASPSPMTLSRYDIQETLGDPAGRQGLWFHPGVGVWQLDSAGPGTNNTAAEAMDVGYISTIVVPGMVETYCANVNDGVAEPPARRAAWQPWVACWEGACEDTYTRALAGVVPDETVDLYGGAELRACTFRGVEVSCVFVDPASAQGNAWWAEPDAGRSPISAPFYSIRWEEAGTSFEIRHWLDLDTGAGTDVTASRPFSGNARDSLTWVDESALCDLTTARGACS